MNNNMIFGCLIAVLLSGCTSLEEVEQRMRAEPVCATFPVPNPCAYVQGPSDVSALCGVWRSSVTTSWRSYYPYDNQNGWSRSISTFTFFADGTFESVFEESVRTWHSGNWSYSDGVLKLTYSSGNFYEYRLLWIDDHTFDIRHEKVGGRQGEEVYYDQNACRHQSWKFVNALSWVGYSQVSSPDRFRCLKKGTCENSSLDSGGAFHDKGLFNVPISSPSNDSGTGVAEINQIPL